MQRGLIAALVFWGAACGETLAQNEDAAQAGADAATNNPDGGNNTNPDTGETMTPDSGNNTNPDSGNNADPDSGVNDPDTGVADAGNQNLTCNPTFGAADACGGNLSGTWNYRLSCGRTPIGNDIRDYCGSANIRAEEISNTTGTLTVTGGTFVTDVRGTFRVEVDIPAQCAVPVGGCNGVETALETLGAGSTANCTTNGASCDCVTSGPFSSGVTGAVSTNGGIATVTENNGDIERYYFCVSGNSLTYRQFDPDESSVFVLNR